MTAPNREVTAVIGFAAASFRGDTVYGARGWAALLLPMLGVTRQKPNGDAGREQQSWEARRCGRNSANIGAPDHHRIIREAPSARPRTGWSISADIRFPKADRDAHVEARPMSR